MDVEIYKDIPKYEGIYQVSNMGNVKSLKRSYLRNGSMLITLKERILKPCISTNGKYSVRLYLNKKGKNFDVHQLVAVSFLNHVPCGLKIVVDHIDNNPLNNRLDNLQLITQRENSSKDVRGGSSKYTGVSWVKKYKKWYASIQINGKTKNLGYYEDEFEAHLAYQNKLKAIIN